MNLLSLDTQKADIKSELTDLESVEAPPRPAFDSAMRAFDILVAVPALLATGVMAVLIVLLNPLLNPGPLFYKQRRMGLGGRPFVIWKFRTMLDHASEGPGRLHHDEVEHHRITPLGRFLRSTRIDELPNFINVLKGDMSVIGPRPDTWEHAIIFVQTVPYYSNRLRVRPGVTGLAQVRGGYADNPKAIERKARFDHHYVRRASLPLALYVVWRTIWVMMSGRGAK
jgi:lipopolysaccharide/colanic/teichoic acid biosynthesis glycosyltransferase